MEIGEENESEISQSDVASLALLAKIQVDPQTYREAMNSAEGINWKKAV